MARLLRALVALVEGLGSSLSHLHGGFSDKTQVLEDLITFLWPLQVPGMYTVHIHTCRQSTQTHKDNN